MKQLTVTINGKGGVGKSMFTINFIGYLEEHTIPYVALDTDNENSTLTRFYPEAKFVDLDDRRQIDNIFGYLDSSDLVVADARAASTEIFLSYFKELQIFDILKQINARLTLVIPINNDNDSIEQVNAIVEEVGGKASYVIVKNQTHGEEFTLWDPSRLRQRVRDLGAQEMMMPKLYDWLVTSLNQENLTVQRALKNSSFGALDTQRLRNWHRKFNSELETVSYLLLPTAG